MSEHKQAGVVASVNSGMAIASRGKHRPHRFRAKLMGLSLLGILIMVGVGFLVYHEYYTKTKIKTLLSIYYPGFAKTIGTVIFERTGMPYS